MAIASLKGRRHPVYARRSVTGVTFAPSRSAV